MHSYNYIEGCLRISDERYAESILTAVGSTALEPEIQETSALFAKRFTKYLTHWLNVTQRIEREGLPAVATGVCILLVFVRHEIIHSETF